MVKKINLNNGLDMFRTNLSNGLYEVPKIVRVKYITFEVIKCKDVLISQAKKSCLTLYLEEFMGSVFQDLLQISSSSDGFKIKYDDENNFTIEMDIEKINTANEGLSGPAILFVINLIINLFKIHFLLELKVTDMYVDYIEGDPVEVLGVEYVSRSEISYISTTIYKEIQNILSKSFFEDLSENEILNPFGYKYE